MLTKLTIQTAVRASLPTVWSYWTDPSHIANWNVISDDRHTPKAENDLHCGSAGLDIDVTCTDVIPGQHITYTIGDGRKVEVSFAADDEHVHVRETFETDSFDSEDQQKTNWQAILDRFKKYVEESAPLP